MLIVMVVIFELVPRITEGQSWAFVNSGNFQNLLSVLPELGLMAIGVTMLLIAGEFDLSVGSVSAFTPVLAFELMNNGNHFLNFGLAAWSAIPIALTVAACIGYITGQITLKFKIHSFVATLGMLFIVRSLAVVITQGFPPSTPDSAPLDLAQTMILGMSVPLWIFIVVTFLAIALLTKTNFGNWIYATGGDVESTRCVGVKTDRVKVISFMLCSFLAGL